MDHARNAGIQNNINTGEQGAFYLHERNIACRERTAINMSKTNTIAWGISLAAAFGAYIIWRKGRNDSTPSLLNTETYYPNYNMETNELLPRGYRNNNPVNIRISTNKWNGKTYPNTDGVFEQFIDMVHGYRAALVLLRGKGYIGNGLNTIRKIITKFAPANENYTARYIADVSKMTGIDPDAVISRNDKDALTRIVYAMSIVENGYKDKAYNDIKRTYGLPDMEIINKAWEIM